MISTYFGQLKPALVVMLMSGIVVSTFAQNPFSMLANPDVTITSRNPPGLIGNVKTLLLNLEPGSNSQTVENDLLGSLGGAQVVESTRRLKTSAADLGINTSGIISSEQAKRLAELVGSRAVMLNIKVTDFRTETSQDSSSYEKKGKVYYTYRRTLKLVAQISMSAVALDTGEAFEQRVFSGSGEKTNTSSEGWPSYPDVHQVSPIAVGQISGQIRRLFNFYNTSENLIFYRNKACGMSEAANALKTNDYKSAFDLSLKAVAVAKREKKTKAKYRSRTLHNLGVLYLHQGKFDEAIAHFQEAHAIKDSSVYLKGVRAANRARSLKEQCLNARLLEDVPEIEVQPVASAIVETPPTPEDKNPSEVFSQLQKLKKMHDKGLLTEEEYADSQSKLLEATLKGSSSLEENLALLKDLFDNKMLSQSSYSNYKNVALEQSGF